MSRRPGMRATAAERMITAIGEPELVDTSQDQRLSRLFLNRTIKRYPAFTGTLRHGRDNRADCRFLSARFARAGRTQADSLPARARSAAANRPSLKFSSGSWNTSPSMCSRPAIRSARFLNPPWGSSIPERMGDLLEDKYNIPRRLLTGLMSPWAVKRLDEFEGDISKFSIVKIFPSRGCDRSASPRPSRAMRTTRMFRHWSASSISASLNT